MIESGAADALGLAVLRAEAQALVAAGDQLLGLPDADISPIATVAPALRAAGWAAARLATGPAVWSWDADGWSTPQIDLTGGRHLRVGTMPVGSFDLPMILPVLNTPGWLVEADPDAFDALVWGVLVRAGAQLGPHLHAAVYRPARSREALATTVQLITTESELQDLVSDLLSAIDRVGVRLDRQGLPDLSAQVRLDATVEDPYRILIIDGSVSGTLHDRLAEVITTGAWCGVTVLIRATPEAERHESDGLDRITIRDGTAWSRQWPLTWRCDPTPPTGLVRWILGAGRNAARESDAAALAEVISALPTPWLDPAEAGLRTLVTRSAAGTLEVMLDGEPRSGHLVIDGSDPYTVGAVLLHLMAARYAPTDLEFVIADVAGRANLFDLTGPSVPHVTPAGSARGRGPALALLGAQLAEIDRRTQVFAGQPSPRRLVVVADGADLVEGDELADLVRRGPGVGVHLLMVTSGSAQTGMVDAGHHLRVGSDGTLRRGSDGTPWPGLAADPAVLARLRRTWRQTAWTSDEDPS